MTTLGVLLGVDIGMADGGEMNGNNPEQPMDWNKESAKTENDKSSSKENDKTEVFSMIGRPDVAEKFPTLTASYGVVNPSPLLTSVFVP